MSRGGYTRAGYNLVDQAVIAAPPAKVWEALIAELSGASGWWNEKNSFTPTHLRPGTEGALTEIAVRPNGMGKPGPELRFTAKTTRVVPAELLRMDYVKGNFSGSGTFRLRPAGHGRTSLSMEFRASPEGWLKLLAMAKDVGAEHSLGTAAAFRKLNRQFGAGGPAAGDNPLPSEAWEEAWEEDAAGRWEGVIRTEDGALLSVVDRKPVAVAVGVGATGTETGTALLIHGWGGCQKDWEPVAKGLLRSGIRVLTLDLRGHGRSSLGRAALSLDLLAADAGAVLAGRGVQDPLLVGHSGGGLAALLLAASPPRHSPDTRPVGVRGLALLGTAVHGQQVSAAELALMGSPLFSLILGIPLLAGRILATTMGPRGPFPGRMDVAAHLAATPPPVRRAYFSLIKGLDLRDEASQLSFPVVLMSGGEDRVVPPAVLHEGSRSFLQPLVIDVPGRGHALHVEAPDAVVAAVREIFNEQAANQPATGYGSA
ncbi:alpha/beta fold hydrolase [Pseudarthrobacter oxydans]|uniref:alpha/beta fold hydrolase n=1 Tax=Pseudarthrobacter oxydans TaxID=1671 RepID=UPI0029376A35|nr:alpha/beta fold hydrolase [Actinomycetes bacterium ARC8]